MQRGYPQRQTHAESSGTRDRKRTHPTPSLAHTSRNRGSTRTRGACVQRRLSQTARQPAVPTAPASPDLGRRCANNAGHGRVRSGLWGDIDQCQPRMRSLRPER
eukprot:1176401-Rhodomonas_salina.4